MAIHIKDKADFDSQLTLAGDKVVIVDFFATWCWPCKMIAPKLEELAVEQSASLVVLKVDVDECQELAEEYSISSMPTFIFIKNGKKVDEFSGANLEKLKSTFNTHKWTRPSLQQSINPTFKWNQAINTTNINATVSLNWLIGAINPTNINATLA